MSAASNPVVGAMIHKDGKLQPVGGEDPSAQWTYRENANPADEPEPTEA